MRWTSVDNFSIHPNDIFVQVLIDGWSYTYKVELDLAQGIQDKDVVEIARNASQFCIDLLKQQDSKAHYYLFTEEQMRITGLLDGNYTTLHFTVDDGLVLNLVGISEPGES